MNEKQLAKQVRDIANAPVLTHENRTRLYAVANELDPPKPEPGTVVWWREIDTNNEWLLGVAGESYLWGRFGKEIWDCIEWKPARILGPRQVAVDVPSTIIWPEGATHCEICIRWTGQWPGHRNTMWVERVITPEEAKRMEASDE